MEFCLKSLYTLERPEEWSLCGVGSTCLCHRFLHAKCPTTRVVNSMCSVSSVFMTTRMTPKSVDKKPTAAPRIPSVSTTSLVPTFPANPHSVTTTTKIYPVFCFLLFLILKHLRIFFFMVVLFSFVVENLYFFNSN
jgi:hypothetical protein